MYRPERHNGPASFEASLREAPQDDDFPNASEDMLHAEEPPIGRVSKHARQLCRGKPGYCRAAAWLALLFAACAVPAAAAERVGRAAVWHPLSGFIADFHKLCSGFRGEASAACFVRAMAQAGAPPAALAFARRRKGEAYLEGLDEAEGAVALAHVVYPFRANENSAWVFVNGSPDWIDVDDFARLPQQALKANAAYRAIRARYPRVTLWPGGRGRDGPARAASPAAASASSSPIGCRISVTPAPSSAGRSLPSPSIGRVDSAARGSSR